MIHLSVCVGFVLIATLLYKVHSAYHLDFNRLAALLMTAAFAVSTMFYIDKIARSAR